MVAMFCGGWFLGGWFLAFSSAVFWGFVVCLAFPVMLEG